jgi:hypothetical protein
MHSGRHTYHVTYHVWRAAVWLAVLAIGLPVLTAAALAQEKANRLLGSWTGTYTCPQGLTGLTLSLNAQDGDTVTGYFHFYPPMSNQRPREGCFSVRGRIDKEQRIRIEAVRWITQPEGYVTVDLEGALDDRGAVFTGTVVPSAVDSAACTTFQLDAQVPAPRISQLCHAGVAALR